MTFAEGSQKSELFLKDYKLNPLRKDKEIRIILLGEVKLRDDDHLLQRAGHCLLTVFGA